MSAPYRTPGEVVTPEEQRRRWRQELECLQLLNVNGRSNEELNRMTQRIQELYRLLNPPGPYAATPMQLADLQRALGGIKPR